MPSERELRNRIKQKASNHNDACSCPSCEAAEDPAKMRQLVKELL